MGELGRPGSFVEGVRYVPRCEGRRHGHQMRSECRRCGGGGGKLCGMGQRQSNSRLQVRERGNATAATRGGYMELDAVHHAMDARPHTHTHTHGEREVCGQMRGQHTSSETFGVFCDGVAFICGNGVSGGVQECA